MAQIQVTRDARTIQPMSQTFDITSVTAKRVGPYLNYYSFNTDGSMTILHAAGGQIVGWDQMDGGGTIYQTATASLALQPFVDNMTSRNPSSIRAVNYLLGGDDTVTGSAVHDSLEGRGGNDTLSGLGGNDGMSGGTGDDHLIGGAGRDRLNGGLGADSFDFRMVTEGGDTIVDFAHGVDHLTFTGSAFGLSGPLVDGVSFIAGAGAVQPVSSAPVLLYDTAAGVLSYDADGTGAGAAVTMAVLANHASLSAADILIL